MFDPPFYDIIFSWSLFLVNYFYSIPLGSTSPPWAPLGSYHFLAHIF